MTRRTWCPFLFGIFCTVAATSVAAQAPRVSRPFQISHYAVKGGDVVVMGLRRWSLRQLTDSLQRVRPGLELHEAACMAVLKGDLHFPDALVERHSWQASPDGPMKQYVIVKLVEPQDSARVAWDRTGRDSARVLVPDYAPQLSAATDSLGRFWVGKLLWPLQFYGDSARMAWAASQPPAARAADAKRLWEFLRARRDEASRGRAMAVLRDDANYANRFMALAVLSNFADHDSTWYAVVGALRDGDEAVRSAAEQVLPTLATRRVNWRPVAPAPRMLLAGTNVSATEAVMELLAKTAVSPALRTDLLKDNGEWVLVHLESPAPGAADAAHDLLVALAGGKDLGRTVAPWRRWIAGL
ncbi:MAG: hypothetical protein ACYC1S_16275 [Gemmatimonadaceae bacterium]